MQVITRYEDNSYIFTVATRVLTYLVMLLQVMGGCGACCWWWWLGGVVWSCGAADGAWVWCVMAGWLVGGDGVYGV